MLYKRLLWPILQRLDAENAHRLTVTLLKAGGTLLPGSNTVNPILSQHLFGLAFPSPLGLAAGFDKDAEVISAAGKLGFGFVEAGTVTPKPQPGNPRPRLFRLKADRAVINRFGFNSKGLDIFEANYRRRNPAVVAGANIGANKNSADRTADYLTGLTRLGPLADYVTVNISSPNTPGLRALQSRDQLAALIAELLACRAALDGPKPPIFVKLAPDVTDDDIADIAHIVQQTPVDALIMGNTTLSRPETLSDVAKNEAGGLSGAPLMDLSTERLGALYQATDGKIPLIGAGGITSGADAYRKIRAGASLLQLYSGLIYEGPGLARRIAKELASTLAADGYTHISDAIGADFA